MPLNSDMKKETMKYPPLLAGLLSIPSSRMDQWGNARQLRRATTMHRLGKVESFEWMDGGDSLIAMVLGEKEYRVEFLLVDSGVESFCNCSSHGSYSASCEHVVAAFMTLGHIADPLRFQPVDFSEEHRGQLERELLSAHASDESVGRPLVHRILLKPAWQGGYLLTAEESRWNRYAVQPDWIKALLDEGREQARDKALVASLRKHGGEFELRIDSKTTKALISSVLPGALVWACELDRVGSEIHCRLLVQPKSAGARAETVNDDFIVLSRSLVYFPNQEALALVGNSSAFDFGATVKQKLGDVQNAKGSLYSDLDFFVETPLITSAKVFNSANIHNLDSRNSRNIRLLTQGELATCGKAKGSLRLNIVQDLKQGAAELELLATVGEMNVGLDREFTALESMKHDYRNPDKLVSARVRRKAIVVAENEIYLAESDEEAVAVVDHTADLDVFRRVQCDGPVRRYLKRLVREMGLRKSRLLATGSGEEAAWSVDSDLLESYAPLRGAIRQLFDLVPGEGESEWVVSISRLRRLLPGLISICRAQGADIRLDKAQLKTVRLGMSIRVDRSSKMDWFELKPQVQADGLELDQDRWEKLVRGELIQDADGEWMIVDTESNTALEQVREVLERYRKGKDGEAADVHVPRLQIFDWLELERAGITVTLPEEDQLVLQSLRKCEVDTISLPSGLDAELRDYQRQGLDWMAFLYQHRFGGCLADDMGLGKTVQTIALLGALREGLVPGADENEAVGPHLIVVPPSLLWNWHAEILRFYPDFKVLEYTGSQRVLDLDGIEVVLTTYDTARIDLDLLQEHLFHVVVFDEAQLVKNTATRRSKAVQQLRGRFKMCLTGTPLENHIGEYFAILELALPGLFDGEEKAGGRTMTKEDEDRLLARTRPFVLRRTKAEILTELPAKTESEMYLDMSALQKELYTRTVGEVQDKVLDAYSTNTRSQAGIVALSALTRLRQICVSPALLDPETTELSPKLSFVMLKLDELMEEGHAALVFSQYTKVLDLIEKHLQEEGVAYVRLDGSTSTAHRKQRVAEFQDENGPPVFLVSLKAGGVGLNLTRASYVFHVDPWWNPAVEAQATDRTHRIGQTKSVFVVRPVMRHTVEEKLMELKKRKLELYERVVGGSSAGASGTALSREDFEFLLS